MKDWRGMERTHRDNNPDPMLTSVYRITSPDGNSWETNNLNEIRDAEDAGYEVYEVSRRRR